MCPLVTDRLSNIQRVRTLLATIGTGQSADRQMKTYTLQHASGAIVSDLLNRTFGIATALGVAGGSFLYALVNRSFRLESFRDADDLINHLIGGVLILSGVGLVVAGKRSGD